MATSEPAARARSAARPIKRTRLKRFCLFSSGLPPRTRFAAGPATCEMSNACSARIQRSCLPSFRQIKLMVASCSARDQASQPADFPDQQAPMSGSVNICGWPFCARAAPPVITTSANAAISFLKIASETNVRSQYYRFGPSSKLGPALRMLRQSGCARHEYRNSDGRPNRSGSPSGPAGIGLAGKGNIQRSAAWSERHGG